MKNPSSEPDSLSTGRKRSCLGKLIKTFAVLAIFLTVVFGIETIRANKAWENAIADLEANGETHTLSEILRPEPPNDENYAAIPLLDSLQKFTVVDNETIFSDPENQELLAAIQRPYVTGETRPESSSWQLATLIDFEAWSDYYDKAEDYEIPENTPAPEAILSALSKFDPVWNELTAALDRPHTHLKNHQLNQSLRGVITTSATSFNTFIQLNSQLSLRARAALETQEIDLARESVAICLKNTEAVSSQPFLISNLVEITSVAISLEPIWHGIAKKQWRKEDLLWLEKRLSQIDLYADSLYATRTELALTTGLLTEQFPFPWNRQNAALIAKLHHRHLLNPLKNRNGKTLCLQVVKSAPELKRRTPYNFIAHQSTPTFAPILKRGVTTQIYLDIARIACRIELYKLDTGSYPDYLAALPSDTPIDLITGEPYSYARTSDGRYKLWSTGVNLFDDEGWVGLKENSSHPRIDTENGDLVWAYRPEDLLPPN